jgi:hypothetical protein
MSTEKYLTNWCARIAVTYCWVKRTTYNSWIYNDSNKRLLLIPISAERTALAQMSNEVYVPNSSIPSLMDRWLSPQSCEDVPMSRICIILNLKIVCKKPRSATNLLALWLLETHLCRDMFHNRPKKKVKKAKIYWKVISNRDTKT